MNLQDETTNVPKPKKKVKLFVVLGIVIALLVVATLVSYKILIPYDIKVNSDTVSTTSGEVILLDYEIEPKSAISRVSYEISDTNVVTINANGELEAKSLGSCNVVVKTINGLKREFKVCVHYSSDSFKRTTFTSVVESFGYKGPYASDQEAFDDLLARYGYDDIDYISFYYSEESREYEGWQLNKFFLSASSVPDEQKFFICGALRYWDDVEAEQDAFELAVSDYGKEYADNDVYVLDMGSQEYLCYFINSKNQYGVELICEDAEFGIMAVSYDMESQVPREACDEVDEILSALGLPIPRDFFN